jgi:hypothetical protein
VDTWPRSGGWCAGTCLLLATGIRPGSGWTSCVCVSSMGLQRLNAIVLGRHAPLLLLLFTWDVWDRCMHCTTRLYPAPPSKMGYTDVPEQFCLSPSPLLLSHTVLDPSRALERPYSGKLCTTNDYPHCHCSIPNDANPPTARASGVA